jgi:hypothetical protein
MINHTDIPFRSDRLKAIRKILDKLSPHEHTDGMNECAICDQELDEAILIELRARCADSEDKKRLDWMIKESQNPMQLQYFPGDQKWVVRYKGENIGMGNTAREAIDAARTAAAKES